MPDSGRMAHFPQSFGFDLPDPLARDAKLTTYLFESSAVSVHEAEPLFQDLPFTLGQSIQDIPDFFPEETIAVMSLGFSAPLSSMKSPKLVSSLSPTGL